MLGKKMKVKVTKQVGSHLVAGSSKARRCTHLHYFRTKCPSSSFYSGATGIIKSFSMFSGEKSRN